MNDNNDIIILGDHGMQTVDKFLDLSGEIVKIQKKFKMLVKKFHPDRNSGNKEFEDKLKKITMAYSHLKTLMAQK